MLGRGKKDLVIGPKISRFQRGAWGRRLRVVALASLAIVVLVGAMRHDAAETGERAVALDMEQIRTAARYFRQDFGRCPHDAAELAHPPGGRPPYLAAEPTDPWGRQYTLQCPSRWGEDDVDVATPGPDGQWTGGDDLSTDL